MTDVPGRIHKPYDTAALEDAITIVAVNLAIWGRRDDSKAQPHVRRAGSKAMDGIDTALAELYGLRARLAGEIRESDDAAAARADRLLAGDDDAPTCSTCGARVGIFEWATEWKHVRGDPPVVYDAGHEATFAGGGDG